MTLENATVLYKHLKEIGRDADAKDLLKRYPQIEVKKQEVKKDGSNSSTHRKKG